MEIIRARDLTKEMETLLIVGEIIRRAKEQDIKYKHYFITIYSLGVKNLELRHFSPEFLDGVNETVKAGDICYQEILAALEKFRDAIKKDIKANII